MRQANFTQFMLIISLLSAVGCASYHYQAGKSLLDAQQYHSALSQFLIAGAKSPDNFKPHREMGITYFKIKQYSDALKKLTEARQLNPDDALTAFYLGQTHEALGELDLAISEYTRFSAFRLFSRIAPQIKKRIRELILQKISTEIDTAVANENKLTLADIPENTLAILNFKNINRWDRLTPLEKGLAYMLTTDLSKIRALRLVERLKLEHLLQEIRLSQSALFSKETTPRLGKLLGARRLIKGGFTSNDEGHLEIVTAVVEASTGELVEKEIMLGGGIHDFFNLEKRLVFKILNSLGIQPSLAELEAIKKFPTQNLLAFVAFARGLDFEDKGDFMRAQKAFEEALQLDPDFIDAQNRLEMLSQPALSREQITHVVEVLVEETPQPRLLTTSQNISRNTLPVSDEATTVFRPKEISSIRVGGTLPNTGGSK